MNICVENVETISLLSFFYFIFKYIVKIAVKNPRQFSCEEFANTAAREPPVVGVAAHCDPPNPIQHWRKFMGRRGRRPLQINVRSYFIYNQIAV